MEKKTNAGKRYNNSFETQIAIWSVLMKYASREHPLSVRDIFNYMGEGGPSLNTLQRYLPDQSEALDILFPGQTLQQKDMAAATHVYVKDGVLRAVLENADGQTLWTGNMTAVFETKPGVEPHYSSIDNFLKSYPDDPDDSRKQRLLPLRLKCVMAKSVAGKTTYIPYRKWLEQYETDRAPTNQPRYYYLESALSKAEWRILADLIKVYPYITETQTAKFLSAINRLDPGGKHNINSRYAFKRESSKAFFSIISQLDGAIQAQKKINIRYGQYVLKEVQGRWTPVLQQRESAGLLEFEPYALMWSNGYYYLVGKNRGMMNLRVDRILSVGETQETFTRDPNFDPYVYRDRSPVMYPGEQAYVRLRCRESMVNTVLDFFGAQANFSAPKNGFTEVSMSIAPSGVKLFAMQYADKVEVLEPLTLRDELRASLQAALAMYQ